MVAVLETDVAMQAAQMLLGVSPDEQRMTRTIS
jgi:hypothetical protein